MVALFEILPSPRALHPGIARVDSMGGGAYVGVACANLVRRCCVQQSIKNYYQINLFVKGNLLNYLYTGGKGNPKPFQNSTDTCQRIGD